MKYFELNWLSGDKEVIKGNDFPEALRKAGYSAGALRVLDFYKELKDYKSPREIAIEWWNNLASLRKTQICDTNTDLVGSVRRWETLTGREVEMLYNRLVVDPVGGRRPASEYPWEEAYK